MAEPIKAFICYRRRDSFMRPLGSGGMDPSFVVNFKAALEKLGFGEVFLDTDPESGIEARDDFESKSFYAIENCDLFVVLIGSHWLNLFKEKHDKRDAVFREIRTALNYEKEILPVLVDDASVPDATDLPKGIQKFASKSFLNAALGSNSSPGAIAATLEKTTLKVLKTEKSDASWGRYYAIFVCLVYFFCAILPNAVGSAEYGNASWWGMARVWGGFFIWPAIFFPFALFALYRPFTTIIRYIVRSTRRRQRLFYAAPLIVSAVLAAGAWALEVYDPREAPWTINVSLPKPGCRQRSDVPRPIAGLPEDERRRWLNTSFTSPPPSALASVSFAERQRWWTLMNLSSYDSQDKLRDKYDGDGQFWLENKCWPNVFYYLTTPIYTIFEKNVANNDEFKSYSRERRAIQKSFEDILWNGNRLIYGESLHNSWTAWSYRI